MTAAVLPIDDLYRVVPEKQGHLPAKRHRRFQVREKIFYARSLLLAHKFLMLNAGFILSYKYII
jgi:hypothetical protein